MSSNIVLNSAGVKELLQCTEIQQALVEQAQNIRGRCGDGYSVESNAYVGKNRAIVRVSAVSEKAVQDNLKNNTLVKALGGSK